MSEKLTVEDQRYDDKLTCFGKTVLKDRYLLPGETNQGLFRRIAHYYGDNAEHGNRLYGYMANLWFMPATPILSNGGTQRGLPISCFLNEVEDSLEGIVESWTENVWLASHGGGIGSYWGNLRSIGEGVRRVGKTSGVIPFIRVMDALTLAISQGSLRRGSAAVYLQVSHPEIEEFIELRRVTGGDPNRKAPNLFHGVIICDAFMQAVEKGASWDLISPKDQKVQRTVLARDLWIRILTSRIETGTPYILFKDAVNRALPQSQKLAGLEVKTSNLCSEITLPTGRDHLGNMRTAVCCLSSLNVSLWDEWSGDSRIIPDIMRFLDNVLEDFINRAPESMHKAKYAAMRERSVGLGVMGLHSFLMKKRVPFESVVAKAWNKKIFSHIAKQVEDISVELAKEKGPCPDAFEYGLMQRFSNKTAIAPTASISIICGGVSPGIEPLVANAYMHKTLSGTFEVRNPYLEEFLQEKGKNTEDVWTSIVVNEGSVQHLDFLSADEKNIFKTAFELNQQWLIEFAGDRSVYIDQSQSVNIFLLANVHKLDLHRLHYMAWKKGLKSLYYCRSKSLQRAEILAKGHQNPLAHDMRPSPSVPQYQECFACQ